MGNTRAVIILAGCAFAVGLVLLGYSTGAKRNARHDSPAKNAPTEGRGEKSKSKWNPALGNVVILVPELGFGVTPRKDAGNQTAAVGKRIENQLLGLRQIYRQEVEKNPALMGSLVIQLAVNSSGNVTHARELASRLTDSDFKKAVIAEAHKWKFPEIDQDSVTINCPLLFVREGMDVTTLIRWEKALGFSQGGASLARNESLTTRENKARESAKPFFASAGSHPKSASLNQEQDSHRQDSQKTAAKNVTGVYEIKSSAMIRREPNFASISLARIGPGTKVTVVGSHGDWLEIQSKESGPSGFIRKEFAMPLNGARQ